MELQLAGKIILVVGGTGFLGQEIMDHLQSEGAVALSATRHPPHDIYLDSSSMESVTNGVNDVISKYGRIDGLVVAAPGSASSLDPSKLSSPEYFLEAFDHKTVGFLRVANEVLPHINAQGEGSVVVVSGQNAFMTSNMAGSVRNAALIVLAKNLADQHAGSGVRINVVNPWTVTETPNKQVPVAEGGESSPQDVSSLVLFLLSGVSKAISGESIAVGHRMNGATHL